MRRRRERGQSAVIELRRAQLSFGDGLIAGEVKDLRESWMNHAEGATPGLPGVLCRPASPPFGEVAQSRNSRFAILYPARDLGIAARHRPFRPLSKSSLS